MLAVDVLNAFHGDSLLIRYGDSAATSHILVDGGPSRSWSERLKPRRDYRASLKPQRS